MAGCLLRPASRGVVEGIARVAHTLAEAAHLQPGEILVTPITHIGWTPYFSLIGGLVTDLGGFASHSAVIAREYGLPCVVNTCEGTRFLRAGNAFGWMETKVRSSVFDREIACLPRTISQTKVATETPRPVCTAVDYSGL